jgi:hypothetical protein
MARPTTTFSLEAAREVFFTSETTSRAIRSLLQAGQVRQLGPRLYTKNLTDPEREVVRRNLWEIVPGYFPGALLADRTGFETLPTDDGFLFLTARGWRNIELPGLTLAPRPGPGPVDGDTPFIGGLHLPSEARRLLENLRVSRPRNGMPSRVLPREQLEQRLETLAARQGEDQLNALLDTARLIAPQLGAKKELQKLHRLIGTILGTQDGELRSSLTRARRAGAPYDPFRIELFDLLAAELHQRIPVARTARAQHSGAPYAFFEAYFSNYIEGTEFPLDEAEDIVFQGVVPEERLDDAHDVLGTFRLLNDPQRRGRVPRNFEDFIDLIKTNHERILGARPAIRPGEFKTKENKAGGTQFVHPDLVRGTLAQGYERYESLPAGFGRAVFQMFLIAEVHPFVDGNGRTARAMMNAELTAAGQERAMVTTAVRDSYISSLRALSLNRRADALVRVIDACQQFSADGDWTTLERARQTVVRSGALVDPNRDDVQASIFGAAE